MVKEKTYIDVALRYTILQLIFLVLGLLIVYLVPVFFVVIPLIPLLLTSYAFGIVSLINIFKGRKEAKSFSKIVSLSSTLLITTLLTLLAIYTIKNQTIF